MEAQIQFLSLTSYCQNATLGFSVFQLAVQHFSGTFRTTWGFHNKAETQLLSWPDFISHVINYQRITSLLPDPTLLAASLTPRGAACILSRYSEWIQESSVLCREHLQEVTIHFQALVLEGLSQKLISHHDSVSSFHNLLHSLTLFINSHPSQGWAAAPSCQTWSITFKSKLLSLRVGTCSTQVFMEEKQTNKKPLFLPEET